MYKRTNPEHVNEVFILHTNTFISTDTHTHTHVSILYRKRASKRERTARIAVLLNRNAISMCIGFNVCAHGFAVHLFIHNAPAWILHSLIHIEKCIFIYQPTPVTYSTIPTIYPYHMLNSVNFSWFFVFVHFCHYSFCVRVCVWLFLVSKARQQNIWHA